MLTITRSCFSFANEFSSVCIQASALHLNIPYIFNSINGCPWVILMHIQKWSRKMSLGTLQSVRGMSRQPRVTIGLLQNAKSSKLSKPNSEISGGIRSNHFQGDFLKLVALEGGDLTWRSIIFDLPKGVLSFLTQAAINSLPTSDNLKWGKNSIRSVNYVVTKRPSATFLTPVRRLSIRNASITDMIA